jgi:hypothetical protein
MEAPMTKEQKERYQSPEQLRDILKQTLYGKKFQLDCGHHITFFNTLGNNITIYNGKNLKIICSQCSY